MNLTVFFPTGTTLTKMDRWLKARGLSFTRVSAVLEPTTRWVDRTGLESKYTWNLVHIGWAVSAF